jgi:hypothetical protein
MGQQKEEKYGSLCSLHYLLLGAVGRRAALGYGYAQVWLDAGGGGGVLDGKVDELWFGKLTVVVVRLGSLWWLHRWYWETTGWRERTYMENAGPEKPNVYFVVAFSFSVTVRHSIPLHLLEFLQGDHVELSGLADTTSLVVVK